MSDYFMGVDIAGWGKDHSTIEIFNGKNEKKIFQVENIVFENISLPDLERAIIDKKREYNMGRQSIGIDNAGIGSGVFQHLLEIDEMKRCIIPLDNSTRPIETGSDGRKGKLLKELMYTWLKLKMERKEIKFLKSTINSFRSIRCEDTERRELKFWGKDAHVVEGIARAIWLIKSKSLNPCIY